MISQKIRLGIVGTGRIAQAHLSAIQEKAELTELVAVCDSDRSKAEKSASIYGAHTIYTDYRELARDPEIDAVIICLPHHLHHSAAVSLVRGGKHVLVEKPMAMSVREADDMIAVAEKEGVTLMVGQSRRYTRAIALVRKKLIEISPLFRIDISFLVNFPSPKTDWWADPKKAGPLVIPLQGSHSIDTILWLFGEIPCTVYARSTLFNRAFKSADEADIVMGFPDGKIASVQLSLNTNPYVHETLLAGGKGTIRIYEQPTERIYGFRNRVLFNGETIFDDEELPTPYTNQLVEFITSLQEKREPLTSGRHVRATMQVLEAACRSSTLGRPINLKGNGNKNE
ncbi:MAG TPA: Gfo/Idh/MocA family oxidoreductase [Spirochaetales bacterium]|nr:Gfo/Idh/MocA family oxidoreductase [Spirochaetales bacterium]